MNLTYALDRLYEAGWLASGPDLQVVDGRFCPTAEQVRAEFASRNLALAIEHKIMFSCWRATWGPAGGALNDDHPADASHGTVVGACEREAAVFALAQLLEAVAEKQAVPA